MSDDVDPDNATDLPADSSDNDAADAAEDPWAAAMAEQESAGTETQPATDSEDDISSQVFQPLTDGSQGGPLRDLDMIKDIPVNLSVELGRTSLTIKQLLELAQGSVVELDGLAGEPMDIMINGYLIAQGEVVVVEDKYGIRISGIITPSERLRRLKK